MSRWKTELPCSPLFCCCLDRFRQSWYPACPRSHPSSTFYLFYSQGKLRLFSLSKPQFLHMWEVQYTMHKINKLPGYIGQQIWPLFSSNYKWSIIFKICESLSCTLGFPGGAGGKEPLCQCRRRKRHKRHGFNPWVWTIPWRRAWQSTLVFLPGESHLENQNDNRGAWRATVHRVTKSWTQLQWLSMHTCTSCTSAIYIVL